MHRPCVFVCGGSKSSQASSGMLLLQVQAAPAWASPSSSGFCCSFRRRQHTGSEFGFSEIAILSWESSHRTTPSSTSPSTPGIAIKMAGNGEPMSTEEPAELGASPSATRVTFENVRIQSLSEDGGAKDKFPGDNNKIRVEYDPEVSAFRSNHDCLPRSTP